ncbi:MAG: ORF6N domain-containing protein [Candidatus Falkowbacteria bacterium]
MSKKIKPTKNLIPLEKIENKVILIRGQKVMLDRDLAELYGVETKVLNQGVKRNRERFPDDFMFQLTRMEAEYLVAGDVVPLRSQFVTSNRGGRRYLPYVFTEQGVAMLSSVLKSKRAIQTNILIMRAFVKIRNLVYSYKDLAEKIEKIERTYNKEITKIFKILDYLTKENTGEKNEIGLKV